MHKVLFIVILSVYLLSGCEEDVPPLPAAIECDKTAILDTDLYDNGPSDKFHIDSVWIRSNCLFLQYSYGGGCGNTNMQLVGYHNLTKPLPTSLTARFSFIDEDKCEAYLQSTESFDLTPYQKNDYPQVILQIEGWDAPILYSY